MKYELLPSLFNDFDAFIKPTLATDFFLDEDEKAYSLSLEMPGVKKEQLKIETHKGTITIKAESKTKGRTKSYHRNFKLPEMVKYDEIEAELSDGILTLLMPKAEESRSKLVRIK